MKSFVLVLCRPDLTEGTTATQPGNLNAMGVIGSWGDRGQVQALDHQGQGGHSYHNGQESQSSNQNNPTHTDLWHWLVNHGILEVR